MQLVEWRDQYKVNIEELDNKHREIFEILNKLFISIANRTSNEIVGDILEDLSVYANTHFKTEKDYFDRFRYPKSSSHKEEHRNFIQKVSEYKKICKQGGGSLPPEITNYLMYWLVNHLLLTDKEYISCFNNNPR